MYRDEPEINNKFVKGIEKRFVKFIMKKMNGDFNFFFWKYDFFCNNDFEVMSLNK